MEPDVLALFIPILSVVGVFFMIFFLRKFENQERMAMIEKGMDLSGLKREKNISFPLRFSLLLVGAGVGLFLAYFLDMALNMEEVAYFSMLFLFGGLGLGVSYLIEEKKAKEEKNNQ